MLLRCTCIIFLVVEKWQAIKTIWNARKTIKNQTTYYFGIKYNAIQVIFQAVNPADPTNYVINSNQWKGERSIKSNELGDRHLPNYQT